MALTPHRLGFKHDQPRLQSEISAPVRSSPETSPQLSLRSVMQAWAGSGGCS